MARHAWLSITPEPERELPRALATLRAGGRPADAEVEAERRRAERLVTRASRRAWRAYLGEAEGLARRATGGQDVEAARELVLDVIHNHDQVQLGLTPRNGGPA